MSIPIKAKRMIEGLAGVVIRRAPRGTPPAATPEAALELVKAYTDGLSYVPPEFQTRELCLTAVTHHGLAYRLVPEEYLDDPEIQEYAMPSDPEESKLWRYLSRELGDEVVLRAVNADRAPLAYVHDNDQDDDVFSRARNEDGSFLAYADDDDRDDGGE